MQADHPVKLAVLAAQEQFWRGLQTKDTAFANGGWYRHSFSPGSWPFRSSSAKLRART
jgi:hypothetical protein